MNAQISLGIQKRYGADAQRMYKAVQIVEAKQLKKLPNGNYDVVSQSDSNHHYQVNPVYECCNCADCEKSGNVCKHLLAWKLQGASASDMEAKAEQARGLEIAENLITRYGTAEERIERGYQKAMDKLTHYEGYAESRAQVLKMSGEQLLSLLDGLYGREFLPEHCTSAQLQAEALRQHEMEWRLPERPANQNQFARVLLTVQKRDVIAEREALKKAERAAQPKTEWYEEEYV